MKQNILLAVVFYAVGLSCNAQQYKHASLDKKITGGQAYTLPKAGFVFSFTLIRTTLVPADSDMLNTGYSPAELNVLKKKYGVDPEKYERAVKKLNLVTYRFEDDSTKVTLKALPDLEKIFYVNPAAKWNKNQTVSFTYATDGILSEGESSVENKTFDIIVKGVGGLASIVGAFFKGPANSRYGPNDPTNIEGLDTALEKFKLLERILNYDIYKDLKSKFEKEYTDIFSSLFYREKKEIIVFKFLYVPIKTTPTNTEIPIFRLDALSGGIVFDQNLKDQIIAKDMKTELPDENNKKLFYKIILNKQNEQQLDYYVQRTDADTGFAYNIPLMVQVALKNPSTSTIYYETAKIPQLGIVGYTNTRKEKLTFQLEPTTGELKKLTIEGKAVTSDQIEATGKTIVEVVTVSRGDSKKSEN